MLDGVIRQLDQNNYIFMLDDTQFYKNTVVDFLKIPHEYIIDSIKEEIYNAEFVSGDSCTSCTMSVSLLPKHKSDGIFKIFYIDKEMYLVNCSEPIYNNNELDFQKTESSLSITSELEFEESYFDDRGSSPMLITLINLLKISPCINVNINIS
jgi:hypothetical protein